MIITIRHTFKTLCAAQSHYCHGLRTLTRWFLIAGCAAAGLHAQQFTSLYSFTGFGPDGADPNSTLVEVSPLKFWGTTITSVFQIASSGTFQTIATFDQSAQGYGPNGPLFPASNGLLYGANTTGPAPADSGSIFVVTATGLIKALDTNIFNSSQLIQATDGNFYGVAQFVLNGDYQVYRMTPAGKITNLHNVGPNGRPGGPLLQASDGNLYGESINDTASTAGMIYRIGLDGSFTQLFSFANGTGAVGGLMQASNGRLYGAAFNFFGGCPGYSWLFSLTLTGTLKDIHNFTSCGSFGPRAGLLQASDGNLYGTTVMGSPFQYGTLFRIAPDGSHFQTLVELAYTNGADPATDGPSFIQASDGAFYGTTSSGGTFGFGTIYRYDALLPPPLPSVNYFRPSIGSPGTTVLISGAHLIGLTGVSFNGVPATQVVSRGTGFAIAVVPAGATTGPITVTTGNGSRASNKNFTIQ